jgi:hypothetical protein
MNEGGTGADERSFADEKRPPRGRPFVIASSLRRSGAGAQTQFRHAEREVEPTEVDTEIGCNATVLLLPPMRTLAPSPAAIVTCPLAPK